MLRPLLTDDARGAGLRGRRQALPPLYTDEGKVSQILRNFISNALKFTERGEVRVTRAAGPASTVVFSVADTGIGIAPEDQRAHLRGVHPGRQARCSSRSRAPAWACRCRASWPSCSAADVDAWTAQPGVGSTFTLTLPRVYPGPRDGDVPPEVQPARSTRRARPVLVVEDDRETLFLYEKYLPGPASRWCRRARSARRAAAGGARAPVGHGAGHHAGGRERAGSCSPS